MSIKWNAQTILVAAGAGVGLYLFAKNEIADAAAKVGRSVDPTSRENVFYRSANQVGAAIAGDDSFSLGAWFYDLTHGDELKRERERQAAEDSGGRYFGGFTRKPHPEGGTGVSDSELRSYGTSGALFTSGGGA